MASILQNKEKVQEAIANSNSIRDALHYLGLRSAGGNYQSFKNSCIKYDLEPPKQWIKTMSENFSKERSFDLKDILLQNSTYSNRSALKKKLYKAGLLREVCYSCGQLPVWDNKPLTLQLEHKNGIWNDNRIENLEILCPNCHTQTNSYAGKSTKK